jgi:2-polyprenyl-6-methoxyphenol hydroxylase-like FAD-dependent oxidoreductase
MMRSYALFRSNRYDEGAAIPSCRVRKLARYDALIVGTRCAGAPLAMLLARKGHNVLGVDRAQFPSDTVSTHFMWPRTTAFLAKWGLLDKLSHSRRVDLHLGGTLTRRMG